LGGSRGGDVRLGRVLQERSKGGTTVVGGRGGHRGRNSWLAGLGDDDDGWVGQHRNLS
jgi:hypothetical protein